jgi:hypothetical protein
MSRWIIAWMLLLLPLQFSWAAVASYCQHETAVAAPAVQHLGHHEHQHASGHTKLPAKADDKRSDYSIAPSDSDCHMCHGLGLGAIHHPEAPPGPPRSSAWAGPAAGPLAQLSPVPPDRPQWPRLA